MTKATMPDVYVLDALANDVEDIESTGEANRSEHSTIVVSRKPCPEVSEVLPAQLLSIQTRREKGIALAEE